MLDRTNYRTCENRWLHWCFKILGAAKITFFIWCIALTLLIAMFGCDFGFLTLFVFDES